MKAHTWIAACLPLAAAVAWHFPIPRETAGPSQAGAHSSRTTVHPRQADRMSGYKPNKADATRPLGPEIEARRSELLAAINAVGAMPCRDQQDEALARVCYEWAGFDPRGAVENAIEWELDEVLGLFGNLAQQWAAADIGAAREWTALQPHGEFRSELVSRIAFAMSQDDPPAAAGYLLKELEAGEAQTEAVISVLHQWALKDPDAAGSWAGTFPAGSLRERALQELAGIARYHDREPQ
jgi:hypothetical protein